MPTDQCMQQALDLTCAWQTEQGLGQHVAQPFATHKRGFHLAACGDCTDGQNNTDAFEDISNHHVSLILLLLNKLTVDESW